MCDGGARRQQHGQREAAHNSSCTWSPSAQQPCPLAHLRHHVIPGPVGAKFFGNRLQHLDRCLTDAVHRVLRRIEIQGQREKDQRQVQRRGSAAAGAALSLPPPKATGGPHLQPHHALLAQLLLEELRPELRTGGRARVTCRQARASGCRRGCKQALLCPAPKPCPPASPAWACAR